MKVFPFFFSTACILILVSCGGGGGGGSSVPQVPADPVNISGTVTYDKVHHNTTTNNLDFTTTEVLPVRGAVVYLLDGDDQLIDATNTSDEGDYSFSDVDANTAVRVQVRAETKRTGTANWDMRVQDNTAGNALYVLQGSLTSSGAVDSTRDLHAASGWSASQNAYTGDRAAAPFAILDTVYTGIKKLVGVDPMINLPFMSVRWSENNRPEEGDVSTGQITTSYFRISENAIYLLGDVSVDSDEYDSHVIAHEWGHYLETNISRSDSIGGSHQINVGLDMRLAFSEGFGNALAAMILDDPLYVDSGVRSFSIDIESNAYSNRGWYNEGSVQSILYDIYDSEQDNADTIELGLEPIYSVLSSEDYIGSPLFTSAHLFLAQLKTAYPSYSVDIDRLANNQSITVDDAMGSTETNNAGNSKILPIYVSLAQGGSEEVCVVSVFGVENKLGARRYVRLPSLANGNYAITMTRVSGVTITDPDFYIYKNGELLYEATIDEQNIESWSGALGAGDYLLDVHDYDGGDACFTVTLN